MWNKIYLALLAVGVIVVSSFTFYAWSWLQSIGDPRTAWDSFNYDKRAGVYFLIGWTALLLVVGNVILWTTKRAWALWTSHIFFAVFVLTLLGAVHLLGVNFCLREQVCLAPSRAIGPLLALFGIVVLGVLVFCDQYVVLRMHGKMYPQAPTDDPVEHEKSSRPEAES